MRPVNKNGYLCKIPIVILQAACQVMRLHKRIAFVLSHNTFTGRLLA